MNVGVLPPPTPGGALSTIQSTVVQLATPLLLLGADLKVVLRQTGRLLTLFLLGSAASCVGAVVAYALLAGATSALPLSHPHLNTLAPFYSSVASSDTDTAPAHLTNAPVHRLQGRKYTRTATLPPMRQKHSRTRAPWHACSGCAGDAGALRRTPDLQP